MQEAVARGTGFEVNRCGVVVVLLHDTADLHGHDMAVARVGLRGIVDLSIHAQRVGRIALAHFHVRRIAAGGDDDALLGIDASVVAAAADDEAGDASVVLFADKLYGRRAIHDVDALGLEFLFKARHQDDVADASRITVRVVQ